MKNSRKFLERMNELDDELIIRADESVSVNKKSNSKKMWIIIAAAILVVCTVAATATALYIRNKNQHIDCDCNGDVITVPISDVYWLDTRERNNKEHLIENSAIVWPWNCRDVYNQYTEVSINGKKYRSRSSY